MTPDSQAKWLAGYIEGFVDNDRVKLEELDTESVQLLGAAVERLRHWMDQ